MATYEHRQEAPLYWFLLLPAAGTAMLAALTNRPWEIALLLAIAAVLACLSLSMTHLTVRDEGDRLTIAFGPLRLFRRRIPYAMITGVAVGRTSWIDGWGIHYMPGRGWTYNLWGFACVVVDMGGRTIRIGSDDAEALAAFLRSRMG